MLNNRRGLLVAVLGNPSTDVGMLDVKGDCRSPRLLSRTTTGVLGHESGFVPDGRTFYVSSTSGQTLVAVDLSNPRVPRTIWTRTGVVYHGMRVSADGKRLCVAEIGHPGDGVISNGGLVILDVSQIQARRPNPQVPVVSRLAWRSGFIPQVPAGPDRRPGQQVPSRGRRVRQPPHERAGFYAVRLNNGIVPRW